MNTKSADAVEALSSTGAAWISPSLKIHPVDKWDHINGLRNIPLEGELKIEVESHLDNADGVHAECDELDGEWHCYEMACDDASFEIRELLLNAGWMRAVAERHECIIEGKPKTLQSKIPTVRALLEGLNIRFETVKE